MANTKAEEKWDRFRNLDIGELNSLNKSLFDSKYDPNQSLVESLSQIFSSHYNYDISTGTGPYAAVVLEVLSGPQTHNEASTRGGRKTKTVDLESYSDQLSMNKESLNQRQPVKVIAKIPQFDSDIDWPRDSEDRARIDAHAEFHQMRDDEDLAKIDVGSVIYVQYSNINNPTGFDGRPVGKIVGVHSISAYADIVTKLSPKDSMTPECQAARNLQGPADALYVGHTEPNPNEFIGRPIRKIKGNIKTGMFGNGTPQTKAHFNESLKLSSNSIKHRIPGPAPSKDNAFIWVGTLKNNGYLDLLDRPIGEGRETIIYAPMTLDLTAPIELKYYFHDDGGFGHAHINGPSTTIENAIANSKIKNNDFANKIGPAIKDLNRDGRNYILVIPEMSYSRGFSTGHGDISRVEKLTEGEDITPGLQEGATIRSSVPLEMRGQIKEYLSSLNIETSKSLLQITPLRERNFSTFDGTFSGGKFGDFHREVLDVLDEHLGTVYDKILDGFISFVADGYGAIALASMVKSIPNSLTQSKAATSFKSALLGRKIRIDYITDDVLDSPGQYGAYFQDLSPSTVLWQEFLAKERASVGAGYTEFNYITSKSTKEYNSFFNELGKSEPYRKHIKSTSGNGVRKFSFYAKEPGSLESFISLHVSPVDTVARKSRVGYAFSMVNDFLPSFENYPQKPDANTSLKPSYSAVPDHAYALSTKPSKSDLEKILRRREKLETRIIEFETLVKKITTETEIDTLCNDYAIYCEENEFKIDPESKFFINYSRYLDDKVEYMETFLLSEYEKGIQDSLYNTEALIKMRAEVKNLLEASKTDSRIKNSSGESWFSRWSSYKKNFTIPTVEVMNDLYGASPKSGSLAVHAGIMAQEHGYTKILAKIESAINQADPEAIKKSKKCAEQPKKLKEVAKIEPPEPKVIKDEKTPICEQITLKTPNSFEELAKMIPFYPKKSDFSFSGRRSTTNTNIQLIEGYETKKFKYSARAANGQLTSKESPLVWGCLAPILQKAWKEASEETGYYPYEVTSGIRGIPGVPVSATAYRTGMSLHSFGLAIDIDPYITGYKKRGHNMLNSIFTGAWSAGFIDKHGLELWNLGVFYHGPSVLKNNAYEAENRPRLSENWRDAPSHYRGGGEGGKSRDKYIKIMQKAKGSVIAPLDSNPTKWMLLFCEKSGMRWGNGMFLKKRWRGGKVWTDAEKKRISEIYKIPNIVDRIKAISWNSSIEDHMHFHYWGAKSLVPWKEIEKTISEGVS